MKTIQVVIPERLEGMSDLIVRFLGLMLYKLDLNSWKNTPKTDELFKIINKARAEFEEFEAAVSMERFGMEAQLELADAANFCFLAYVAIMNEQEAANRLKNMSGYDAAS